ncbi:MAG: glycosyltransferase family 4 protein [Actinomycetota bacterium]|nr:glycosyltransferase family 4 protein [Actinomycetota bacterium]
MTRILFLTCHLPYPPFSGGRLREFELIKRLGGDLDIHLCAVSKTYAEDAANIDRLSPYCSDIQLLPVDPLEQRSRGDGARAFQVRRHGSSAMGEYLAAELERSRPDVVHVEGFYVMQHLPKRAGLPVLLVEQNVEYLLWRQKAEAAVGRDEREAILREYLLTLEAETEAWRAAALCAAVTDDDREAILAAEPGLDVRVVPDGADHLRDVPERHVPPLQNTVAFIANYAYEPNVDGALYLLDRIWPRVRARVPSAQLLLVGNAPPASVADLAAASGGVTVTGRVAEVEPYLTSATLVVCPLRVGGGVKVKVLEALSRGKAIVTTSVGAQGFGPEVGSALEIHDRPAPFADAVVRLLRRPARRAALEQRAAEFALGLPTWDQAAQRLRDCYDELAFGYSRPVDA